MDTTVKLDEQLWSGLPSMLSENLLAYLPCSSFFRFRSVCKQWNSLLSCPNFLKLCTTLPLQTEPCMLFQEHFKPCSHDVDSYRLLHYDPKKGVCSSIDLEFLKERLEYTFKESGRTKIYAADGGLLLISTRYRDMQPERLSVCNPLLKSWRQLPILPSTETADCCIQELVVDKLTKTYKVIVVVMDNGYEMRYAGRTHVYDSNYNRWNEIRNHITLHPSELIDQTIVCGNVIYVMTCLERLIAYDIGSGVWSEVSVQLPTASMWRVPQFWNVSHRCLVTSRGRVLLVVHIAHKLPISIALWELKIKGTAIPEWKELASTFPPQLDADVFPGVDLDDDWRDHWWWAMGFEDHILVWRNKSRAIVYGETNHIAVWRTKSRAIAIVYDLLQGSWRGSPNTTLPMEIGQAGYMLGRFSVGSLSLGMEA
ncbi:hypothetical protein O6H91_08G018700 [Diphasiastrum complanatum]|uniref:Uncharacterized protein n=1 Tax=Diphasiastrum complanatum TaxID=34168 RepID=A0ACC2CVD9_DIPCM|nr:hypothetical protein O6H91_08G018700 [Diphasiastrum complanatum]